MNKPTNTQKNIHHLALLGMFTAMALAIYIVESWIPVPIPIPGVKLGLANVVTLFLICDYSPTDALAVLVARIILGAVFAGQAVSFAYSLAGGLLCLATMLLINRILRGRHEYLTGIFGAIAHNIGQILVAFLVLRLTGVFAYVPYLCISGIATGLFTGLVCHFLRKYLNIHAIRS